MSREVDNRDLREMNRFLEARIEVLQAEVRRLTIELEAKRRDEETVRLLMADAIRRTAGLGAEFTALDVNAHLGAREKERCEQIGASE